MHRDFGTQTPIKHTIEHVCYSQTIVWLPACIMHMLCLGREVRLIALWLDQHPMNMLVLRHEGQCSASQQPNYNTRAWPDAFLATEGKFATPNWPMQFLFRTSRKCALWDSKTVNTR